MCRRSTKEALSFVKTKVMRKIQGWKQGLFTQTGKETLIKAMACAVPTYPMACFKCPKVVCDELNRVIAKFWWRKKKEEGRINWVSWSNLTKVGRRMWEWDLGTKQA